ncbi:3-deoxy-7-phosphoheptulonate synthase [Oscillibacter sp. MSJ-2]|uniref:3-deoxy-7-phosphoheptulonate synthase n=1 Tax=Dysosmobacter acutus TaxID=2841504 RepID=A0ABS6F6F8_9FIRM|nr:3-deoxy-7-phosphoheptulonate synthase [Dysosmobacter acutus]MBU5625876.1 3-deoxy-7-phosphoheptulonate synthase [Dysosmobacter acutus]
MIIVLKPNPDQKQLEALKKWLSDQNLTVHDSLGVNNTVLGLVGDTTAVDTEMLRAMSIVQDVQRVQEPYKCANRKMHQTDTVIDVGGVKIGGGSFQIMAGPCSIESEEQISEIAVAVKAAGASILRGGAFKPRTSPYAFQGLREKGLEMLIKASRQAGMPVVTEIMDISQLPYFEDVDVIQVGARNMQNFELLKELGRTDKPILLKRGFSATLTELLMSAEYIMAGGNEKVILCERGIRTFATDTRNTLDLSAIPLLRRMTHLPIIVDPSHGTGIRSLVKPMALASAIIGADGLMVEVHNHPEKAWCDGQQSITPETFADVAKCVRDVLPYRCREEIE